LSEALQVIACVEPAFQSSPPLAAVTATSGAWRSAVPELVKVSAKPEPRTVSTPAGSQVAEMITWPPATRSQVGLGATPAPVSVQ
jgi:hypothetical protein